MSEPRHVANASGAAGSPAAEVSRSATDASSTSGSREALDASKALAAGQPRDAAGSGTSHAAPQRRSVDDRQEPGVVGDELLMVRFQGGDRSAFALLVRRHQTPLYNFAMRQVRSAAAAEDIVQEAFVRVVQNAADFKHEARFTTWVYTIVRNLCIDHLRKGALRKHPSLDERRDSADGDGPSLGEQTADARASVERDVTGSELLVRMTAAVNSLPDDQREVFLMREVANLPFKEIAVVTGVSENTAKSRMRYALERLQEALAEYEDYAKSVGS